MVWTTLEQLQHARTEEPLFAADSLFQKASDAGIANNEKAPTFPGLLSNTAFLQTLVDATVLSAEAATAIQVTVAAGSALSDEAEPHKSLWSDLQKALLFSSLPETYAYSDIAMRLVASGQLANLEKASKRLSDTGEMITALVDGMSDGSGTGLHAAFLLGARHQRLSAIGEDRWINQVSLAFTLLTFSFTPFAAMLRASVAVPTQSRQLSWLAMWNVVGSLMGIGGNGLPATLLEAEALDTLIRSSAEFRRTEEGEILVTVLVQVAGSNTGPFWVWGGEPLMELLGVQRVTD